MITVNGVNDAASISGTATGSTDENSATAVTGVLAVSDVDNSEDGFVPQSNSVGNFGTFGINVAGSWSYTLNNVSVQNLSDGDVITDSFEVDSIDGTASEEVIITIMGVNDDASISGDNAGDMTEDAAGDAGVLAVSDVDDGEAVFQAQTSTVGTYGNFAIDAAGNWIYTRAADLQSMAVGETLSDSFTVVSHDETASELVTIITNGLNDGPIIADLNSNHADLCAAAEDGEVSIDGSFADIDLTDTHSVSVDWGDGTASESLSIDQLFDTISGDHTYGTGGIFTITVAIDDGNGGVDVGTTTAVVQGVGLVDGVLYIVGTDADDHTHVEQNSRGHTITVDAKLGQGHQHGHHRGHHHGHHHRRHDDRIRITFEADDVIIDMAGDNHIHAGRGNDGATTLLPLGTVTIGSTAMTATTLSWLVEVTIRSMAVVAMTLWLAGQATTKSMVTRETIC